MPLQGVSLSLNNHTPGDEAAHSTAPCLLVVHFVCVNHTPGILTKGSTWTVQKSRNIGVYHPHLPSQEQLHFPSCGFLFLVKVASQPLHFKLWNLILKLVFWQTETIAPTGIGNAC